MQILYMLNDILIFYIHLFRYIHILFSYPHACISISGTTKQALSKTHQLLNTDDEALLSEISSSSDDEDTLSSGPALTCPCPPRSQATTTSAIHGYLGGVSLLCLVSINKKISKQVSQTIGAS